jgi:hypothetical protein
VREGTGWEEETTTDLAEWFTLDCLLNAAGSLVPNQQLCVEPGHRYLTYNHARAAL